MTCLAADAPLRLSAPSKWDAIRAAVFWGFILSVIVSPAALGAVLLLRG